MVLEKNKTNREKTISTITYELNKTFHTTDQRTLIPVAFVLHAKSSDPSLSIRNANEFLSSVTLPEKIKEIIRNNQAKIWPEISDAHLDLSLEDLCAFILHYSDTDRYRSDSTTPDSLLHLSARILEVKSSDSVLDLGCGTINLFVNLLDNGIVANYYGIDINSEIIDIAYLRAYVLKTNINFYNGNAFEYDSNIKYDKIFSNYPFLPSSADYSMMSFRRTASEKYGLSEETFLKSSSDWLFNTKIIDLLSDDGKAIAIMRNGSTWNRPDKLIREFFIKNGLIEAIITLPNRMFSSFNISTTLLVLSKNNVGVRMINAGEMGEKAGKYTVLTNDTISVIIALLNTDTNYSVFKTNDEIAECEYVLNPSRYMSSIPQFDEGVSLSEFATIYRGAQLKAEILDEMKSDSPTGYRYITLADISDGTVSYNDSQYIKPIDKKLEKYCAGNNSIVISKIGSPNFKSAVIIPKAGEHIFINGNLYIIEIDETKADANYIQAFLDSNSGRAILDSLYTGTAMKTLPVKDLSEVKIPLPGMDIQKQIGKRYAECAEKAAQIKSDLLQVTTELRKIFDESYQSY